MNVMPGSVSRNIRPDALNRIRAEAAAEERARIVAGIESLIDDHDATHQRGLLDDGISDRFAFHNSVSLDIIRRLRSIIAELRGFTNTAVTAHAATAGIPDGTPACDGYSVGAIITDPQGRYLLITRVKPPAGRAFIAGHIDEHGDAKAAVIAEVAEEAGLTVTGMRCVRKNWVPGRCRRRPSPFFHDLGWGHQWFVFEVDTTGTVTVDESEVTHPHWATSTELSALATRTVDYAHGRIAGQDWIREPGLEPAWLLLLASPGLDGRPPYLNIRPADQDAVAELAMRNPYSAGQKDTRIDLAELSGRNLILTMHPIQDTSPAHTAAASDEIGELIHYLVQATLPAHAAEAVVEPADADRIVQNLRYGLSSMYQLFRHLADRLEQLSEHERFATDDPPHLGITAGERVGAAVANLRAITAEMDLVDDRLARIGRHTIHLKLDPAAS